MSSELQHKDKIKHNEHFLDKLDVDEFKDWAVTGYFYCAVHAVECLFAKRLDVHTKNHSDRKSEILAYDWCNEFKREYEELYDLSIMSRYECINMTGTNVWEAQEYFSHIKKCVMKV